MEEPLIKATNIILLHSDIANKQKYCLVMENYIPGKINYIIFYITSKVDKYGEYKWCVVINQGVGNLPKKSVVDCNNYFNLRIEELKKAKLIGVLPENDWKRIHEAISYARKVPFDYILRIRDYEFYKTS